LPPKWIIRGLKKKLGVDITFRKFRHPDDGMAALDKALDQGKPVGIQASVFWLPYFPPDMRFHFNAHNLIVYGRENNNYLISDPIFDQPMQCEVADLKKARFAKGALAAKGLMYCVESVPDDIDLTKLIRQSIRSSVRIMIESPVPIVGIKGMRFLARKISRLDKTEKDVRAVKLFLANIIRMQEEIGTGGAGFRFIYASFLQESAHLLQEPKLLQASNMMTEVGDKWRGFAVLTARMCKKKDTLDLQEVASALIHCADEEEKVWRFLKTL
jgi:hypothetical protein